MDATETVGTWIGLGFAMVALLMLVGIVAFDEFAGWLRKRRERPKNYRVSVRAPHKGSTMSDEPLIWTSKGNLPIASLEYTHAWNETPEYLKFSETYLLDGEIVKQSAHVYVKQGAQAQPEQGTF